MYSDLGSWDCRVHIGIIGYMLGLYGDDGKENGKYYDRV